MQKLIHLILMITTVFSIASCSKKSSGGGGSKVSHPPVVVTPDSCLNQPQSCNGNVYNGNGFSNYNYNNNQYYDPNLGFCGCQPGSRPVVNGQWGMGCINTAAINYYSSNFSYSFVFWITNAPQADLNIQDAPYTSDVNGGGGWNNCYSNAISTCNTGVPNACGAGNICRPIGGGSYLGACVKEVPY